MEYKVLYRKYRPQDFDSIVSQNEVVRILKNSIKNDKISHAYIFTGPRGTGKTSTAKIFAKAINCENNKNGNPCNKCDLCKNINENPDIIEIDAASNNGVDDIRNIIDNVRLAPSISKYKIYIIDEFHMLSTSAFNALLLTLEEPPKNVVFILATTDIQSVPITILSRCQRFDFKPITIENLYNQLKYVSDKEKIKISDEALKEIAYMSNGGLRDALSILDQISSEESNIDVDDIIKNFGSISEQKIQALIKYFDSSDTKNVLNLLENFKNDGVDYRILMNKLIVNLKQILINIRNGDEQYNTSFDDIYNMIFELYSSINNDKNSIDPYIFIEIVLLKYMKNKDNIENSVQKNSVEPEYDRTDQNTLNIDKQDVNLTQTEISDNKSENIPNKQIFNKNIRINNCFANAKKEYLSNIKNKWNDFITYESNANKKLMSYIMDTDIVTASDKYAILVNKLDSSTSLINEYIKSLEKDFKGFYGLEYKFVCLDVKEWEEQKKMYVFNIKNNIKYSIINEVESESDLSSMSVDENDDELEKLATEIFEDNVVIK